ncbi:polyprenyl synthetase family protein [Neisseriaceae bacterium ESL0693]|nr:polyprenyl synthetase family protein [Neisseriaceae bacterium ESL0693]
MKSTDFLHWQKQAQAQTELILGRLLPDLMHQTAHLQEAMRYVALNGGKRLRPMLVLATAELGQADQELLHHAVAAIECMHVYSLVHDDMPEMDNDSLRHGRPTCHVQYDGATALLVGDALQTLAFELLSQPAQLPALRQLRLISTLARAAGNQGMAGGQAIDLAQVGQELTQTELERMHQLKTGALIRAAVTLGALVCADIDETAISILDQYASRLGLAFQVIDDVLDCEQKSSVLGKTAGKDQKADKPTYVKLMGLAAARQYAETLIHEALAFLDHFDDRADHLRALAQFTIRRNH